MKKHLKTVLRVLISGSLIGFIVYTQDLNAIKEAILGFDPLFLFLAFVSLLLGTYVSSIRWKTILSTSKIKVSEWYLFTLYLKGYFYNNFLPTQMGGDVYKSVALGRKINNQSLSLFSVFMDRFGGLVVLLILALFGIGSLFGTLGIVISLILLIVGLLLYFPVLNFFASKIKFLRKFKKASDLFVKDKKSGFLVLFYSTLVQVFSFAFVYFLFMGLNVLLPLEAVFVYMPIASLALLIPSINGFGTQETVYAFLFKNVGITTEISVTASILNHSVRLVMSLIGGLIILMGFEKNKEIKNEKV